MLDPRLINADIEATRIASEQGFLVTSATKNEKMLEALELCLEAEQDLPNILAKVPVAKPRFDTGEVDPIEVDAYAWRKDYITKQVQRAARAARERKAYLATLLTEDDWADEWERCADGLDGLKHWFKMWAWALDPRADYMPMQPFVPFGAYEDDEATFQWEYIVWLHETTFDRRASGLVEKSRDMGATLGWILWATWCWLFRERFTALLISRREEDVDSKKEPDTLFEKIREALRFLPPQLVPLGFSLTRDTRAHMNLYNPETNSVLTGAAPTANVARGKRRTAILKDESASWPQEGKPQSTSLGYVSNSNFDVSSVQGRLNNFYTTAMLPTCNKYVMDWRDHPWKDARWYNALPFGYVGDPQTAEQIAQEVDRDYDASQPGKVFKDWEETRTCIEWPEVYNYFNLMGYGDRFQHVDGSLKIPDDWEWSMMQDKGETEGHPRMTLFCARPAENWPLSDTTFFFMEHMAPTGADLGTVVTQLTAEMRFFHLEERRPQKRLISHEAAKDRAIYLSTFGWSWQAWDTDYDSGIGNIRLWIKPVDTHRPNPFRPVLNGRSRMILVCTKGQATLQFNEKDQKFFVTPALSKHASAREPQGFIRLRAEMPAYHYPAEEAGKPLKDQRPERKFDDAVVCVRGIAVRWGPKPKEMTEQDRLRERLAESVKNREGMDQEAKDAALLSEGIWIEEFKQQDKDERLGGGIGPIKVPRSTPRRN